MQYTNKIKKVDLDQDPASALNLDQNETWNPDKNKSCGAETLSASGF